MDDARTHGDGLPGPADLAETPTASRLEEKIGQVERLIRAMMHGRTPIPKERKYTYAEAAFRIQYGLDPAVVGAAARDGMQAECLSRKVIGRLTRDGDCPLKNVRVGGSTFVTEASIQNYEDGVRRGWIDGYQVVKPRKYRK